MRATLRALGYAFFNKTEGQHTGTEHTGMFKHILIATDGSELARKAVVAGFNLASALKARATAVIVSEPWTSSVTSEALIALPVEDYDQAAAAQAASALAAVSEQANNNGVDCATLHVKDRYPADGMIETAQQQACDLIVMASHGRTGIARLLLGSQAMNVVTNSPIPVLICR